MMVRLRLLFVFFGCWILFFFFFVSSALDDYCIVLVTFLNGLLEDLEEPSWAPRLGFV